MQRRNQKVVERAPAAFLTEEQRADLCDAALKIGRAVRYRAAGTVEFLQDADTGKFYFIEVNPRIQVEHTVTECVTGIDLVKAQIRIAGGARIGTAQSGVPRQEDIRVNAHALQCRVTTEDPENNFVPDYGRVTAYRSPAGFGIRLDAGTAYSGAIITRFYDSLLVKVTAWSPTPEETIARMHRALWEFRIRGVVTNLRFLDQLIMHPSFAKADYTTQFIDQTPELFRAPPKRDRATRLLSFIGDVIVNGNPEVKGRGNKPPMPVFPKVPRVVLPPPAVRHQEKLDELGPELFAGWMLQEKRVLITDTSMRDAHQSLLATRFRTQDMAMIAPYYASLLPQLFSVECWGGATFDVAMRYLKEDPWARLASFREAMPNLLLQMLLRSANAVGYTNYPDNVVRHFVAQASAAGIDVFRVFDCLNWTDNMKVAIEAVRAAGRLCEGAICYTGNLSNPRETKYDLQYYLEKAKELKAMGAHVIAIKDMAGLCQPRAAAALVGALKNEVGLPIHFHTHDTSGIAAASVLAAIEAGADAVDGAIDALSGLTSQPNLGSIVEALRFAPRDPLLDPDALRSISGYWEQVRRGYVAFESDIRAGTSEVYVHGMPGGQYTNLREQVRSLGIDEYRWPEVAHCLHPGQRDVRRHHQGDADIQGRRRHGHHDGDERTDEGGRPRPGGRHRVSGIRRAVIPRRTRPASRGLSRGRWRKKCWGAAAPLSARPGELLPPADLNAERASAEARIGRPITEFELASHLMYPKVFAEYATERAAFGDVSTLPTCVFFYGMEPGQEINIDLERGKTLIVRYVTTSDAHDDGTRSVFFELNGQPRPIRVADRSQVAKRPPPRKIEAGNREACRRTDARNHQYGPGARRSAAWPAAMYC